MIDLAHAATDKELARMEKHLAEIYERANNEIGETWKAYLAEVEKEIKSLQDAYDAAKLSGDKTTIRKAGRELSAKKREKTILDTHYRDLTKQLAVELSRVNETAVAYINGRLPNVYALNYNATANGVKTAVSGYSFELVDASTVRNLATSDKTLLPYKYVDGKKDVRWNTTKVNSEVLQGILQGESIPKIANRLSKVVGMNEASAIRNARTTVTSAENKGRMDMLHDAADKGVITHKVWMATHDSRVREAHADLDGQEQEIDEPFESELGDIMYPGDPGADPANVYNCRCTLTYKVVGFESKRTQQYQFSAFESGEEANRYFGERPGRSLRRENREEYDRQMGAFKSSSYGKWYYGLDGDEISSVSYYSGDGYHGMNGLLRGQMTEKMVDSWSATDTMTLQERIDYLSRALSRFELEKPIKVYRTCEQDVLAKLKLEGGSIFHDDGFVSTSVISEKVASGNIVMEINVPAGRGVGAWINPLSGAEDKEYEFLLQRGSNFIVDAIEQRGEDTIVRMTWTGSTQSEYHFATKEEVIKQWIEKGIEFDEQTIGKI